MLLPRRQTAATSLPVFVHVLTCWLPHVPGRLDNKGLAIDFQTDQHNTKITIPFLVSSRQYGFVWNHPGWGGVDLAEQETVWTATMAR